MGVGKRSTAGAITLEELVALNDEMAALIRAGVPLELGLASLGGEMPGRPGQLAQLLASRMGGGESLSQVLADEDPWFPPVWRAVVEAGVRSGNLAGALESLSATARRTAELRKLVAAGILYPLVVLSLAYTLFLLLLLWLIPKMLLATRDLTGGSDALMGALDWLGQTAAWWAIPLPLVAAAVLGAWWHRSGRVLWTGRSGGPPGDRRWRRPRSGIRQTLRAGRTATFAEVLSLLVKQQVPMHDAVVLAADSSGDRALAAAAREIAARLKRGESIADRGTLPPGFPPSLGWLLVAGPHQPELSKALSRSAAVYRHRAARAATWTAVYVPILLTVFAGGTATLLCGLVAFVPMARLLYRLAWP